MQNTTMEAPRRRPLGVSIIAVLVAIQGIFFLILGILALVAVIVAANSAGTTVRRGIPSSIRQHAQKCCQSLSHERRAWGFSLSQSSVKEFFNKLERYW
jgi:Tfp pilus assembly protein PilV